MIYDCCDLLTSTLPVSLYKHLMNRYRILRRAVFFCNGHDKCFFYFFDLSVITMQLKRFAKYFFLENWRHHSIHVKLFNLNYYIGVGRGGGGGAGGGGQAPQ